MHVLCVTDNNSRNTVVTIFSLILTDSQFPIDISSVKRDHDFLERDLVEPLCR